MRARFATAAALAAAWLLALALPAIAQEARKYDAADTVTVVSVDPQQQRITVRDREGGERTFAVDENTRIARGGEDIALGDVESQARVVVNARPEPVARGGTERLVADTILVVVADTDLATEPAGSEPLEPLPAGDGPRP